jgi:hypothetical protein
MHNSPISEKRLEANRRNAQNSTGPKTEAGKSAIGRNAVKHGLTAALKVAPDEDPEAFKAMLEELREAEQPQGVLEEQLVLHIGQIFWRLQRQAHIETLALNHEADSALRPLGVQVTDRNFRLALSLSFASDSKTLTNLGRYETRLRRDYHRSINDLRQLRKDRLALELAKRTSAPKLQPAKALSSAPLAATGNGFVSQNHHVPESETRVAAAPSTSPGLDGFVSQNEQYEAEAPSIKVADASDVAAAPQTATPIASLLPNGFVSQNDQCQFPEAPMPSTGTPSITVVTTPHIPEIETHPAQPVESALAQPATFAVACQQNGFESQSQPIPLLYKGETSLICSR